MAKDIYTPKRIPRIEVREKLHGHTQILLRSERTGKVERIEHDNTFTDGIESYFRDLGFFGNSPFVNATVRNRSIWKTALGGVYLFDAPLPTSPAAKYMPAGTSMTANGSYGVSNNSDPAELGSFNSVESAESENSLSLVYDWNTSQGNGTIASVALGTDVGGFIGYGNKSLTQNSTIKNFDTNQNYTALSIGVSDMNRVATPIFYNGKLYRQDRVRYNSGDTQVKIKYKNFTSHAIDVFDNPSAGTLADFTGEITFTLPNALTMYYDLVEVGKAYPSKYMLVPALGTSVSSGGSCDIFLLDVVDASVEKITITNNTGVTWNSNAGLYIWLIDDTYAIVMTAFGSDWYKINYRTSAVIGVAANGASSQYPTSGNYQDRGTRQCGYITDSLMSIGWQSTYIYDPSLNRFLPMNGSALYGNNPSYSYEYIAEDDTLLRYKWGVNSTSYEFAKLKNPLRLMTINNLDSTVTKDATKTMKVTYTITRA